MSTLKKNPQMFNLRSIKVINSIYNRVKELKEIKKVAKNKKVIDNIINNLFLQVYEIRN